MRGTATKMKRIIETLEPEVLAPDQRLRQKDKTLYVPIRLNPEKPLLAFRVNGSIPVYTSTGQMRSRDGELLFASDERSWFGEGSQEALFDMGVFEKKP